VHFDHAVFSGDLGIVKHDIGAGAAQDYSRLAQAKNLASRGATNDCERDGLVLGKMRGIRMSLNDKFGMTLIALTLQVGFARELFLVNGVVRATMGAFNRHGSWWQNANMTLRRHPAMLGKKY
jgi:hypothetical protein